MCTICVELAYEFVKLYELEKPINHNLKMNFYPSFRVPKWDITLSIALYLLLVYWLFVILKVQCGIPIKMHKIVIINGRKNNIHYIHKMTTRF